MRCLTSTIDLRVPTRLWLSHSAACIVSILPFEARKICLDCMQLVNGCSAGVLLPVVLLHTSFYPLCLAGGNGYGQVGNGQVKAFITSPTAVVGNVASWAAISAGFYHACGLATANGMAYCWGEAICHFVVNWELGTMSTTAAYSLIRPALPACRQWPCYASLTAIPRR